MSSFTLTTGRLFFVVALPPTDCTAVSRRTIRPEYFIYFSETPLFIALKSKQVTPTPRQLWEIRTRTRNRDHAVRLDPLIQPPVSSLLLRLAIIPPIPNSLTLRLC